MKYVQGCLLVLLLAACGSEETTDETPLTDLSEVATYLDDPLALARGESIFMGTCATFCHSPFPDEAEPSYLFDCDWRHGGSDQEIFDIVTNGIPETEMVGFGSNFPDGDADLWKLIAYLRANQQSCEMD